ncbi:MAG TPA: GDP-mannose 4,6-dehydratase [Candidatus Avalokitesvara rifleensis]|uniref:GDP-mannose 4,6-dehydratase n=1 Tax=Candidatus Avalokitesvara rifleensis TaxID=3367620 RepID=UPI00271323C2|nr:GDP-mannose 4,6-dehydratase [Candidatus Brocadiales bacterium]
MKRPKKTRVLITGITGFVGSHLVDYILANHPEVEIYGLVRWRSPMDNLMHISPDKYKLLYGDLMDLSSLIRMMGEVPPEIIFHLAAQSYVKISFDAPIDTLQTNVIGTTNLLEAIRLSKTDPVIHICSSSEVYGQVREDEVPIKEANPFRPASPYAVSKVAEDMIAFQYWLSYGIKNIRTRMFTHTGPRRGEVFAESAFAKQIALIEKGKQEPVIWVGNLDSVRTFSDVRDAVKAYWLLVNKCRPGEVYNIGGNRTMKIGEMLDLLLDFSPIKGKAKIEVDPKLLRLSDVTLQIPDCSKFKTETGWEAEIPLEKTLEDTLNYWRKRV